MDVTIGKRLLQLRKQRNISQQALATQLGVTRQTISKWEQDLSLPDINSLVEISELFDVSINELIGIEKNEQIPITYDQIQTVLNNKKKHNIHQIIMLLICIIGLGLMISMKFDLTTSSNSVVIQEYDRPTQMMFYKQYHNNTADLDRFVDGKTYTNISEFNFDKCTITLDYHLTLKEASTNTTMSIEFTDYKQNTNTYSFEKLDNNTYHLNQTIPIKMYNSILLKINNDTHTVIEDITNKFDSNFHELYIASTAHFYVPANSLNTIQYAPHESIMFDVVGYPKGTFSLTLYDENYEQIHEESTIPMDRSKTITLNKPLKTNEKVYVALEYAINLNGTITNGSYTSYYGKLDGSTVLCNYFVISDSTKDFTICGFEAP